MKCGHSRYIPLHVVKTGNVCILVSRCVGSVVWLNPHPRTHPPPPPRHWAGFCTDRQGGGGWGLWTFAERAGKNKLPLLICFPRYLTEIICFQNGGARRRRWPPRRPDGDLNARSACVRVSVCVWHHSPRIPAYLQLGRNFHRGNTCSYIVIVFFRGLSLWLEEEQQYGHIVTTC